METEKRIVSESSYDTVASEVVFDNQAALISDDVQTVCSSKYNPAASTLRRHSHKKTNSSATVFYENPYKRTRTARSSMKRLTITSNWGIDEKQDQRNSQIMKQLMAGDTSSLASSQVSLGHRSAQLVDSSVVPFATSRAASLRRQLSNRTVKPSVGSLQRSNAVKRKEGWLTSLRKRIRQWKSRAVQKWRRVRQHRLFGRRRAKPALQISAPILPALSRQGTVRRVSRTPTVSHTQKKQAMDRLIRRSQDNLIDRPDLDQLQPLLDMWSQYLKNVIGNRIHLKLDLNQLSRPTAATHERKESLLGSILADYVSTDESDTNSMVSEQSDAVSVSTAESSILDDAPGYLGVKGSWNSELNRHDSGAFSFAPSVT
ncbi:hypothetical protein OGAPHI_000021 [Ogataea philodendri]|uniref:Uncharacterized protein n=1 Tax=Ogataea philodendri TaxID=1378263 RepID=A0A9P8PHQ1_9ASCO|nr:uncharacterized protein OGAPHI_000021 [Ogataea philodendri]KAH3671835.1 hypothetical protein OGAPHI_000021 [Ogataea philodendri]